MRPRAARLAPSPLRRALLLLVPLALLGTALMGLLAQSASAHHDGSTVPPTGVTAQPSPDSDTTPSWSTTMPSDVPETTVSTTYDETAAATTTVTIQHDYSSQCVYGRTPAVGSDLDTSGTACPVSFDGTTTTDGDYVLSARTQDVETERTYLDSGSGPVLQGEPAVTTSYSTITSGTYVLDTTAPKVTVTGPTTAVYTGWSIDVDDLTTSTARCVITGPAGYAGYDQPCADGATVQPPLGPDGLYTLTATATDGVGLTGSGSASFVHDGTAPVVRFTSEPPSPSGDTSPAWSYSASEGTVSCTLNGSPVVCGSTSYEASGLTTGDYVLTVVAADAAGNTGQAVSQTYVLDASDPVVSIASPQGTRGTSSIVEWTVTYDEGTATCALSTGTSTTCSSGSTLTTTLDADGTVTLTVTATDAHGNSTVAKASYTRDTTVTLTLTAPVGPSSNRTPTWSWSSPETYTIVGCELLANGTATAVTCTGSSYTPAQPLPTTSGTEYELRLTVKDDLGNERTFLSAPAYLLDTEAAVLTLDPAPGQTATDNSLQPSWTFGGDDWTGATCLFTVQGSTTDLGGTCGPDGFTAPLLEPTDGTTYVLTVTVTDALGNSSSATTQYVLDTTAPTVGVTAPAARGKDTTPTWALAGEYVSARCVITSGGVVVQAEVDCESLLQHTAHTLPSPTSGTEYVLTVTVRDAAGNTASDSAAYLLDTVADLTLTTAPATPGNDPRPVWVFALESGAKGVTCRLTGSDGKTYDASCTDGRFSPSADLPRTSGTTYTLVVTVTDAYDNVTSHTLPTYRLDTVADLTPGTAPTTPGSTRTPRWTFVVEPGAASATCVLTDGAGTTHTALCTGGSYTAPLLDETPGTTWTLTVTVVDALGNDDAYTLAPYLLDSVAELAPGTAPTSGPTVADDDRTPTWTFTPDSRAVTVTCTLTSDQGETAASGVDCASGTFTPAADLPMTPGTTWTLTVTVTDALGNVDAHPLQAYLLDTVATLTVISAPPARGNDTTPTWTFTPEGSATCTLAGPGAPTGSIDCSSGSYTPPALPATAGADYVLTVTVTDALGNVTLHALPVHHLDTQLPVATVTVPASPSRETTVTWTVTVDEALASATCELRRDGVVVMTLTSCPGSTTVSLPGDGRYDLVVTLLDTAGNRSTTTSGVLVHDATVPTAPVVSPGSQTTNRTTATWTVTGEGGTSVTTCRVTRGTTLVQDWTTCGGTFSVPLPADGEYLLEVRSTDPVGSGPTTTASYLLDTVLPVAPGVTGPTGPSQSRTPAWTVTTESGTTTECQLVRGSTVVSGWAPCTGGFSASLDGLPDGGYVLESRATDTAQNVGAVGRSAPYVLDTTAPLAPIVSGPAGPSQNRTPGSTWTGEAGTKAECQLSRDGTAVGGWTACTSPYAPTLDRDGTWTLAVRLVDAAGNVGETATTGGYVLDTTAPPTPVVTPPKTPGRDLAPSWGAVVEGGTRLECRLTGPDGVTTEWTACTLPHATPLTGRPDGAYVLEVRATDAAGNLSPVGSGTYVLDTVAPAAAVITSPASPSRSRTPSFTWTTEAGATTRCRLTSGSTLVSDFAPCTSPAALDLKDLPDGTYTLTVRVTDAAGNPGPAATGTYVLDTTAPAAPVASLSPATPSPARSVTWAFTYEPGATLTCELLFPTGAVREIASCASPLTVDLTGLPDGSYTLTVRAVDAAGNVGAALREVHVLDSTALAPPAVTGPATPGSTRTPRWTITPASTAGTTECRLSRGTTVLRDWATCSGGFTADLFGQPDGTYVLSVRSKDASGQLSAAVTSRYVLDATGPLAATLVAPPTPSTNRMPTWSIASSDLGARAECRVLVFGSVLADWAPCAVSVPGALHPVDLTGLGDGTYTLVVRLVDAAGNRGPEASSSYVLDTSAPAAVGITGPATPGNDTTPTWLLASASGVELECRVTSAAGVVSDWAPCSGEHTADLTGLPDGVYTLAVRAVSAAGTPGPETTSAYELVTALPGAPTALALASGTKPTSNNRAPSWTFTLPPGTTGVCKVVRGATTVFEGPCSSGFRLDLSGAPDGSYTLSVRALDAAGNLSPAATSTYVLDTVPTAEPVFTQVPGATGSTLDPQWRFSISRDAKAQCRLLLDGRPLDDWAACATPFTAQLTGRPDGRYVLQVRAVDAAGNTSAPVSNAYLLDRTAAPVVTFTDTPPATGSDRTVSWTFAAPDGTTLECRVVAQDGSSTAWGSCTTAAAALRTTSGASLVAGGTYRLDLTGRPDQLYTLEVRTVGADGRRGAASSASYRLDTRPPATPSFSDVPPAVGADPRPVWLWDLASDELVECRLVRVGGGPVTDWQECGESQYVADLTRLGQGAYALELRVTDAAGNVSPVTSAGYRYDTTAPAAPVFSSRPPSSGSTRAVTWTFVVPADTRATCTVTRDRTLVREGTCGGRYDLDLSGLPDGTYVLTVRFTDAAGNESAPTSGTYALRTLGLGGPVRVDPPPVAPDPGLPSGGGVTGPGRGGTGIGTGGLPVQEGSSPGSGVPIPGTEVDVVRASTDRPGAPGAPAPAGEEGARDTTTDSGSPLLPGRLPVEDVPEVLRDVVTGTISKPTLPLALLAIVLLFLLAQNRIDRRDPKLAAAPVEAEPELDFTAFVRPRSALS